MLPKRRISRAVALLLSVAWISFTGLAAAVADPGGEPPGGPVVTDWRTGIALYGMDPVGYLAGGKPMQGLPALELPLGGAVWRFRNEGNRAAFAASPRSYWPGFGGYDPIAVARGVAAPGSPLIWAVFGQRLYLFHTLAARAAFLADPLPALAAALARWPGAAETRSGLGVPPPVTEGRDRSAPLPDRPMR